MRFVKEFARNLAIVFGVVAAAIVLFVLPSAAISAAFGPVWGFVGILVFTAVWVVGVVTAIDVLT